MIMRFYVKSVVFYYNFVISCFLKKHRGILSSLPFKIMSWSIINFIVLLFLSNSSKFVKCTPIGVDTGISDLCWQALLCKYIFLKLNTQICFASLIYISWPCDSHVIDESDVCESRFCQIWWDTYHLPTSLPVLVGNKRVYGVNGCLLVIICLTF